MRDETALKGRRRGRRRQDARALRTAAPALLVALAGLVASALVMGCSAAQAEDVDAQEASVVGGRVTSSAHPAVGYLATSDDAPPFCTATLVEPTYIVTAAHCVRGARARDLVFGTGAFDPTARRTSITRCRNNPAWKDSVESTTVHDFAFCELESAPAGVTPIAFVTSPAWSATYVALGYGQTDPDDEDSAGPRKQLSVRRVDPEDEPLLEGLEDMLAARSTRGDTCFGDSGGPLLVVSSRGVARIAGVLHGGVTDGDTDCGGGGIGLYAPIGENLAFWASR